MQEVSQSLISYWKKDELRSKVKKLKQKMDELDKNRKAAVMTEVRSWHVHLDYFWQHVLHVDVEFFMEPFACRYIY